MEKVPNPDQHETTIQQLPGGPVEVRCSCGQWGGVAPSFWAAERDAAQHRQAFREPCEVCGFASPDGCPWHETNRRDGGAS